VTVAISQTSPGPSTTAIDKISSGSRTKSAFRDARYRPVFQALAAYQAERAAGGTSVTWRTPSHPLFPKITLDQTTTAPLHGLPAYPLQPEALTDRDRLKDERHWRRFYVQPPRDRKRPAPYRDLSDETRLEWYHHAMRHAGTCTFFTVHLDDETTALAMTKDSAACWLQDRITKRLKEQLGYWPAYWFVIERGEGGGLHLHGEIGVDGADVLALARKAFRQAAGEWDDVRQHQAHTRPDANVLGSNYAAKESTFMKPSDLPFLSRPIAGNWYAATDGLRSMTDRLYTECRRHVDAVLPAIIDQAKAAH
jgi:hypothetical protein